jgi:Icc-related predicted phosphoesterase
VQCIFVSDLHGSKKRYDSLFKIVEKEKPDGVFLGGDLLPGGYGAGKGSDSFLQDDFLSHIFELKQSGLNTRYFTILGNDDPRSFENILIEANKRGLIDYVNNRVVSFDDYFVLGYAYCPPSPFQLKDWEKFDVSQYVDIGAISPEHGFRSTDISQDIIRYTTIADDLKDLTKNIDMDNTIGLFHSPPYNSFLDRAALDDKMIDHVPVDVHVGSIAIQQFIKIRQPFITLHGHVHETVRLTGNWKQKFGKTYSFSAAHDGPELVVVRFNTEAINEATRALI